MSKKLLVRIITILALSVISVTPTPVIARAAVAVTTGLPKPATKEDGPLLERLKQINNMDKSALTSSEKKQLRKEVRGIKKQMRENNNGIYLSVGAIIIIILLLILIL